MGGNAFPGIAHMREQQTAYVIISSSWHLIYVLHSVIFGQVDQKGNIISECQMVVQHYCHNPSVIMVMIRELASVIGDQSLSDMQQKRASLFILFTSSQLRWISVLMIGSLCAHYYHVIAFSIVLDIDPCLMSSNVGETTSIWNRTLALLVTECYDE